MSFWTVGNTLTMTSTGADQRAYQMIMSKGDPGDSVAPRRVLFGERGTELRVSSLLEGIRTLSGEKIQWYLASELRDRIRCSGSVRVIDKLARKQYEVEPRQFEGRLLHQLPAVRTAFGDAYAELYLAEPAETCRVALTRAGTRVIEDMGTLPGLEHAPWNTRYVQGLIDVPYLNLTPGTRSGIVHDEHYAAWVAALAPLEAHINALIEAQQRAEEEQANRESLRLIQRAFREAMLALPREEYDWFDIQRAARREYAGGDAREGAEQSAGAESDIDLPGVPEPRGEESGQRQFFEYAGPLHSVAISPSLRTVSVNDRCKFRALPRDRSRRRVEEDLSFAWEVTEGGGALFEATDQEVTFQAPAVPGLVRLSVAVSQRENSCKGEALITVAASFTSAIGPAVVTSRGLPGYTSSERPGNCGARASIPSAISSS